jgi:hypothetical protein
MGNPIINNPQVTKQVADLLDNQFPDKVPEIDLSKIVLVANVNPKNYRRCDVVAEGTISNGTNNIIYTTPTDKDFFLTSAMLHSLKDVTSTSTSTLLGVVIAGASVNVLSIYGITLTVQDQIISNTFFDPIKIDRGSQITVKTSTAVANVRARAVITGYTVEP